MKMGVVKCLKMEKVKIPKSEGGSQHWVTFHKKRRGYSSRYSINKQGFQLTFLGGLF